MKKIIMIIFVIIVSCIMGNAVLAVTASITTDDLNIRESASTDSNAIGLLNTGDKVEIIATEGEWYKINYNGKEGYIKKEYVKEDETENNPKIEDTVEKKEAPNITTASGEMELTVDANLYVLPLLNSTKLTTLIKGTKIKMISNHGKWLYVQTDTNSGWIISSKTSAQLANNDIKAETKIEKTVTNETATQEIVSTPESSNNQNTVKQTTTNEKKEESYNGDYPVDMYVNTDSVYIRSGASTDSDTISGRVQGDVLKVIGKEGDWYKVSTIDGTGYVKSEFLTKK